MASDNRSFSPAIIAAAADVARTIAADALFAYVGAMDDPAALQGILRDSTRLILVARSAEEARRAEQTCDKVLTVPEFDLTRMAQIKMAVLLAIAQGLIKYGDVFVFLTGAAGGDIDTFVTMRVGAEYELFQSVGQPKLTEHIRHPVFEKVLRVALELAHQGREGKPVGTLFVVGDHREVSKYCLPGRINPFRGYTEKERNILDESMNDVVKEIAKMDGAFVVKGNGVVVSACVTLRATMAGSGFRRGWGAATPRRRPSPPARRSVAISLSESTGDVRIWRRGAMITEIEKSPRPLLEGGSPAGLM